jgi:uncharacterized protein (TIGR01777 family)
MVIAISGSSGLIGSALARAFTASGHEVRPLVRRAARTPNEIQWQPEGDMIDASRLEGVDAIVNLAGENLGQHWTREVKRRIRESRVKGTQLLARTIASLAAKPQVFISGSAIGIYGSRGDEPLDEMSTLGDDFLAGVCKEWEAAAAPAEQAGVRVVLARTSLVLSRDGGVLPRFLLPFRLGVGGRLGSGKQWMSWIGIPDYVAATTRLLTDRSLLGPVNLASPNPVTNEEFSDTLANVLSRPAFFAVPEFVLKLVMGEMIEGTALASQRVRPHKLLEAGFTYQQPTLDSALRPLLR